LSLAISEERAFQFLESLQKQFQLYADLIIKSEQQRQLLELSDEEGLMKLLVEKQEDLSALEVLSKDFEAEKALLEKTAMGEFSCIDQELDQVLAATEKLLLKLVENETRDMNALEELQDEHRQKIGQLEKGRQMAKAYLGKGSGRKMDESV
jgi:hypothetical protein